MCKVKTGERVEKRQDLQNLVTSVILRSGRDFNENVIYASVKHKLKKSNYGNDEVMIKAMIKSTCRVMENNDCLIYKNGNYHMQEALAAL